MEGKDKEEIIDQFMTFFMWIKEERGILINRFTTVRNIHWNASEHKPVHTKR